MTNLLLLVLAYFVMGVPAIYVILLASSKQHLSGVTPEEFAKENNGEWLLFCYCLWPLELLAALSDLGTLALGRLGEFLVPTRAGYFFRRFKFWLWCLVLGVRVRKSVPESEKENNNDYP